MSSSQPLLFFCWDTQDIKQMILYAKYTPIVAQVAKACSCSCLFPMLTGSQQILWLNGHHNAQVWWDRLYFPQIAIALSSIPQSSSTWLWNSFHGDMGSMSSLLNWAKLRWQQKWYHVISKAIWLPLGSPYEGCFWNPATISGGSPSSPRKPRQEEPKLPAEASTQLPFWKWISQLAVELPQLMPGGTETDCFCWTQPRLQIFDQNKSLLF